METPESREPLDVVARKIETHARKADEHVITAAMLIREARERVKSGEAGDLTWYEWAPANIKLSSSRLRELQRIANAEYPAAELERQRKLTQKRVEKHRQGNASNVPQAVERAQLRAWVKKASIEQLTRVLEFISTEFRSDTALTTAAPALPHREAA
jgi:hypothetical protein